MSESPEAPAKPPGRLLTWAIVGVALVGVAGAVYIIAQSSTKTPPPEINGQPFCVQTEPPM